ncbi:hypothetical protein GCM10028791_43810 [Echinicola sediminis]
MQWAHSIKNRVKLAILLMVVFVAVFIKNLVEEENVSDLTSSFTTIYEDRLLPESYIFHLSENLLRKQMLLESCEGKEDYLKSLGENQLYNAEIDSILIAFEATHLTGEEAVFLTSLRNNIEDLYVLESDISRDAGDPVNFTADKLAFYELITKASGNLNELSEIQLAIGKELNDQSQRIKAGSSVLSKFEMALLLILGILINILIFGVISTKSRMKQRAHLN